ncbi:ATP-dependent Clp protease adaptor ClpS [Bradyrhizobium sp. Ai1a-2]|uniref:ATP-dependent Clp protease adaptor ClpS n=1 Tax=Bradyrhizobium sp. Ai1a-2 TaxID=196490 RepID=UPI0003F84F51|nr:ATP-dependent Clp protease adaptor ClpS [Bradyrhizobium sp. Ai1a-2]
MRDVFANAESVRLVFHNDHDTPEEFVVDLLRSVFGKSEHEIAAFMSEIEQKGKAGCGPYPAPMAAALLDTTKERVRAAGYHLYIASEATNSDVEAAPEEEFDYAFLALQWHFQRIPRSRLVTSARQFPGHMRSDIQVAIDRLFASPIRFFGIHEEHRYETMTFAGLMKEGRNAQETAPPQYQDVDIGEALPVRCLYNGLWLCEADGLRYAVLLGLHRDYGRENGIRVEIAVPAGAAGGAFVQRCFAELEKAVRAARSYRGKILSFDDDTNYRGGSRGIMVHRLPPVEREAVILPELTLKLLDRNVVSFVRSRDALRRLGQSTRKGVLLYGPPGTGKTHTIRYLATNLPDHTTLIITAEQVGALGAYMSLARLLQPAMVVIEDVDLIAVDREYMGPCEESLLNKLLNEMDGLKEDAEILFVLTTNRPEELESALAGRPGRIDQAIEVPLPDAIGRGKLVGLYGRNLSLDEGVVDEAVRRTDGVSAAFIKELMRRLAQASIARDGGKSVISADIDEALDDMLFAGGRLNVKLLGGAQEMAAG